MVAFVRPRAVAVLIAGMLATTHTLAAEAPQAPLHETLERLAAEAKPGVLGITVVDLDTHARTRVNADRAYPMMSVFKAPVAAAVLAQVDAGHMSLDEKVTITRDEVVGGSAVPSIGARFVGDRMRFTVGQLLEAAVADSDNTAVDALLRRLGGPRNVMTYLHAHHVDGMRIDLSEGEVNRIFADTVSGGSIPRDESEDAETSRLKRGYAAYLKDPRNRTTPDAAAVFLEKLWAGELLSSESTKRLLDLMYRQTTPNRMRAGLPANVRFADKCGTSYSLEGETAAYNDIGIVTWPNGHTVVVAAFLTASKADKPARDALFAKLGKAVVEAASPAGR
ncbi:class A beta-lactamase [Luteibacter sp. CQ10]|uniref:class A beta-lactamase n=1 Tax=Luteibacter sp. CQ10 TaxID=2805821 RepID=UPI0034A48FE6